MGADSVPPLIIYVAVLIGAVVGGWFVYSYRVKKPAGQVIRLRDLPVLQPLKPLGAR